jgi:hypothetical protein
VNARASQKNVQSEKEEEEEEEGEEEERRREKKKKKKGRRTLTNTTKLFMAIALHTPTQQAQAHHNTRTHELQNTNKLTNTTKYTEKKKENTLTYTYRHTLPHTYTHKQTHAAHKGEKKKPHILVAMSLPSLAMRPAAIGPGPTQLLVVLIDTTAVILGLLITRVLRLRGKTQVGRGRAPNRWLHSDGGRRRGGHTGAILVEVGQAARRDECFLLVLGYVCCVRVRGGFQFGLPLVFSGRSVIHRGTGLR